MIALIEVADWTKKHRSELEHWPTEPNRLLPIFMLRTDLEPYEVEPINFAIIYKNALIGRFTYRISMHRVAFVGLAISPAFRGKGLGIASMRASLARLGDLGIASAYCSVAMANLPSLGMLRASGFYSLSMDWRLLPSGYDCSALIGFPASTYRVGDRPAMLYSTMCVSIDYLLYAEVAQR